MIIRIFLFQLLVLSSCMSWNSPINKNSHLGSDRIFHDGGAHYRGSIEAFESVSQYLQNDGQVFNFRFELLANRESGKVSILFLKAEFNASGVNQYQDIVAKNYEAESWRNKSFDSKFMRSPIDKEVVQNLERKFPENSIVREEQSLIEVIDLLLTCITLDNFNSQIYVGNETIYRHQLKLFGHQFVLSTSSNIVNEKSGLFFTQINTQSSCSYFDKYDFKNQPNVKSSGTYFSITGDNSTTGTYDMDTLLVNSLSYELNTQGFQQTYFSESDELYMVYPTRLYVSIRIGKEPS